MTTRKAVVTPPPVAADDAAAMLDRQSTLVATLVASESLSAAQITRVAAAVTDSANRFDGVLGQHLVVSGTAVALMRAKGVSLAPPKDGSLPRHVESIVAALGLGGFTKSHFSALDKIGQLHLRGLVPDGITGSQIMRALRNGGAKAITDRLSVESPDVEGIKADILSNQDKAQRVTGEPDPNAADQAPSDTPAKLATRFNADGRLLVDYVGQLSPAARKTLVATATAIIGACGAADHPVNEPASE